jgi:hypothetical protein
VLQLAVAKDLHDGQSAGWALDGRTQRVEGRAALVWGSGTPSLEAVLGVKESRARVTQCFPFSQSHLSRSSFRNALCEFV